jgi:V-type H+-transporting ATPase subunit B
MSLTHHKIHVQEHVKAISTDYNIAPRIDYRTVLDVEGPLVVLDNVKFPRYAEIVNVRLGNGVVRKGQVLEIKGKQAVVQVSSILSLNFSIDLRGYLRHR